jgi:molybdenum cofactor synthesis domain-containing protein
MTTPTAAALIIGNEILTGKVADANLAILARTLRGIGVRLVRAHTVLDEMDTLVSEIRSLSAAHTWLVTSGGVGPTHDDLTIEAVAKAFDRRVVVSEELEALLRNAYAGRVTEGHLLMARVPEGATLVRTDSVPWPSVLCENVFVLPGVPEIFALKMEVVADIVGRGVAFVTRAAFVAVEEGRIKHLIDACVGAHRDVEIGSYPRWGDKTWRTKITFDAQDEARIEAARAAFVASLPEDVASTLDDPDL